MICSILDKAMLMNNDGDVPIGEIPRLPYNHVIVKEVIVARVNP